MGWFSGPRLADLLKEQAPLLDEIFGAGTWTLGELDELGCTLSAPGIRIQMAYDPRDRWVSSLLDLPDIPDAYGTQAETHSWLQFLGRERPVDARGALDARQVRDELGSLKIVVKDILADPRTARDAAFFIRGYSTAYNDYYAGASDVADVD